MNFLCVGIFSFLSIDYLTCIVPERWDIVQVIQFLEIDLPKFRFSELGSKSAIKLNNNMHNFYKCQKDYVHAFHKPIWWTILYPFFCPIVYYITYYVCVPHCYVLSALAGCWSSVSIGRINLHILNVLFSFDYTVVAVSGRIGHPLSGLTTSVGLFCFCLVQLNNIHSFRHVLLSFNSTNWCKHVRKQ